MFVDNFDLIRSQLTFETSYDQYICHIMRRAKDVKENKLGSEESQRLIKTYYINSIDYFDRKKEAIIELCESTHSRAYFLPQVRNSRDCLISLGKLIFENIDNTDIKLDNLVRRASCSCHKSRNKKWILDFDDWSLEYFDSILKDIKENLILTGRDPEKDLYIVPTKNGKHIITSPFNQQELVKKHPLIFEGVKTINGEKVVGLLHKDSATLLYY